MLSWRSPWRSMTRPASFNDLDVARDDDQKEF